MNVTRICPSLAMRRASGSSTFASFVRNPSRARSARHSASTRAGGHADGERDPQWHEHDLVEVSEHRDEVGDEVDRTERVRDDCSCERIRVPRRARVAAGEVERERLPLELSRAPVSAGRPSVPMRRGIPCRTAQQRNHSQCRAVQKCYCLSTTIPPSVRYSGSRPARVRDLHRFEHRTSKFCVARVCHARATPRSCAILTAASRCSSGARSARCSSD